jgi:dolichol-phosphate mannosyltransferase
VSDGSTDNRLVQIAARTREDPRIKVIHLSRNFGHHIASTASLDFATGAAVVVVDADLQQPLPVMHEMICRYCEGYDVAYAPGLVLDGERWFKKFSARLLH